MHKLLRSERTWWCFTVILNSKSIDYYSYCLQWAFSCAVFNILNVNTIMTCKSYDLQVVQEASDREWIRGAYCCNMEAVLSHGWGDRRGRPSIQPPCLIDSAWAENPPVSVSPDSVPESPQIQRISWSQLQQKRKWHDRILELLEREVNRV